MAQPPEPRRSQSTTSLSRFYNGANGSGAPGEEELSDPRMDFCNAFWGQGDRGYEVVMARLRGAARTVDELRAFWKERAAIEEDYAKRLAKLSKYTLGKDEIGDLAASLQNVVTETAAQASYHQSLSTEIKQNVEQPTAEFATRLVNLKKGLQGSVEKSYRNKGLQEGHVAKAKERYESDCLKLNSYTANAALTQGKDLEKLQGKLERVRQTIGGNEQDFRQFVKVLEGTTAKWENEWRGFCDHVQDLEEDRLTLMKDIIWAYANAISQVCVEDDGSCERIREKLETFEPLNDMVTFVKGWGTGDQIPDPPRFVNYSAGEYPQQPSAHPANFRRLSSKPPLSAAPQSAASQYTPASEGEKHQEQSDMPGSQGPAMNGLTGAAQNLNLNNTQPSRTTTPQPAEKSTTTTPFGGVALPGLAAAAASITSGIAAAAASILPETHPAPAETLPKRNSSMGPPPVPPSMTMPEPRIPSRQGPPSPNVNDEEDPMAKALAELRRDPPGPGSIRRNASHRRPESVAGSTRSGYQPPASPAPGGAGGAGSRLSYQSPPTQSVNQAPSRQSVDMTLSPPAPGHTAAQLARSMDDFQRSASRGPDKRNSVNYSNFADDVVGAHPSSRPSSPAPSNSQRAPSPAMMQPPVQPATHIADEVVSQYHQAFPGERRERNRSRAGSMISSRPGSAIGIQPPIQQLPPASPREGFVGIGAGGGRSPSPQPAFTSPGPQSHSSHQGALGPQNLGIALDKSGGVAHDSMAEAYRRQYQEQQAQQQGGSSQSLGQRPGSQYGQSQQYGQQQQYQAKQSQNHDQPKSPSVASFSGAPGQTRPVSAFGSQQSHQQSAYGGQSQQQQPSYAPPQQQQQQYGYQNQSQPPPQPSYSTHPSYQQQPQQPPYQHQRQPMSPSQPAYTNGYSHAQSGYGQGQGQPPFQQQQQQQQQGYGRSASPAPPQQQSYGRSASPAPQQYYNSGAPSQQQQAYRAPSPQPQQPQYQATSPQPSYQQQQQQQQRGRSPSPQPNMPPPNAAPTGQWSTTGLPVLFYVKALYDYTAQSTAEFDFQAGDIIAVTSTPEDGWWSGELLDEARRLPGRTDFPSNFVCLF